MNIVHFIVERVLGGRFCFTFTARNLFLFTAGSFSSILDWMKMLFSLETFSSTVNFPFIIPKFVVYLPWEPFCTLQCFIHLAISLIDCCLFQGEDRAIGLFILYHKALPMDTLSHGDCLGSLNRGRLIGPYGGMNVWPGFIYSSFGDEICMLLLPWLERTTSSSKS